jgi:hypothetical protein
MTEAEWLACDNPTAMLTLLEGKVTDRKLRLFAIACCRNTLDAAGPGPCRATQGKQWQDIEVAEQVVDGSLPNPMTALDHHYGFYTIFHGSGTALETACHAAFDLSAWGAASGVVRALDDAAWSEGEANCGVVCLREVFGNPFRPATFDPAWRTSTAVTLATQMYGSRDFGAMPILADALQDAGCDSDDVLGHCRGPGPHVRGCWVVDLVLGKS